MALADQHQDAAVRGETVDFLEIAQHAASNSLTRTLHRRPFARLVALEQCSLEFAGRRAVKNRKARQKAHFASGAGTTILDSAGLLGTIRVGMGGAGMSSFGAVVVMRGAKSRSIGRSLRPCSSQSRYCSSVSVKRSGDSGSGLPCVSTRRVSFGID